MNFLSDINLLGNSIIDFIIDNKTDDPQQTDIEGSLYYNTVRNVFRVCKNGQWVDLLTSDKGKLVTIVNELPLSGSYEFIYLLHIQDSQYKAYIWNGNGYSQLNGPPISWSDIGDRPQILDIDTYDNNTELLKLKYI